ncbi:MAG: CBS domain-containing protein [Acidobacteria bacterium]|nr:CBS domain-containing protein [Acidobacteriota bacterium]
MPTVKDVLASKKSLGVITVLPDCSVRDACRLMRDRRIGALLVSDGDELEGIFTERDVMNLVVAEERDPSTTRVSEVMTRKVVVVRPERRVDEVEAIMRQERVRHVPVVGEKGLIGMISIGDVNAFNAAEDHQTVEYLTQYIQGRA